MIKADRLTPPSAKKPGQSDVEYKLFCECWKRVPLMDIHHFPPEKGARLPEKHFEALQRIFAHPTKGISGIDSAADALEMELEEFHDFIKDAKLETKMVNFDDDDHVREANATSTAEAFEQRQKERRTRRWAGGTEGAHDQGHAQEVLCQARRLPEVLPDRFADYPEWGSSKAGKKPTTGWSS